MTTAYLNAEVAGNDRKPLHVVFIVDVTRSMNNQVEGVKQTMQTFCVTERPGVQVHIWSFTENARSCFVCTSKPNLTNVELLEYVANLKLSCPIDHPLEVAHGDDAPENVTAAVAQLALNFDNTDNVLAFIITNAPPHHRAFGEGKERQNEQVWLQTRGFSDSDVFSVLKRVVGEVNVTLVSILYSPHETLWYQQAALLTGGLCLIPSNTSITAIAEGLSHILHTMQHLATTRQASATLARNTAQHLRGFYVLQIDPDGFEIRDTDTSISLRDLTTSTESTPIDTEAVFGLLETVCDRFSGKKALKRIRTVKSAVVVESVKVMVLSVLKGLGREHLFDKALFDASIESLKAVYAVPPAAIEDVNKMDRVMLERLAKFEFCMDGDLETLTDRSGMNCIVALETVMDNVLDLDEVPRNDEELMKWMDIVMQLCMVRLVCVKFPLNSMGKTDFKDAWSCHINDISLAYTMNASEAMKLRFKHDCDTYIDPLSPKEYTSAVILAHPNDPALTFAYQALTALPSLHGLIQGYLVLGGLNVFPSLTPGLQSSCLLHLINNPGIELTDSRHLKMPTSLWEAMRTLVWSIQKNTTPAAVSVLKALKEGKGMNPVDAIPKLLAVVVLTLDKNGESMNGKDKATLMRMLFEEVSADAVAKFNDANENLVRGSGFASYAGHVDPLRVANCFVDFDSEFEYDSIAQLHPAELFVTGLVGPSTWTRNRLSATLAESKLCIKTIALMRKMELILQADMKESDPINAINAAEIFVDDDLQQIMLESVLVRKRTGRYLLDEMASPLVWVRNFADLDLVSLSRDVVADAYKVRIGEWNRQRTEWATQKLSKMFKGLVETFGRDEDVEQVSVKLGNLKVTLHERDYKLCRMDALNLLDHVQETLLPTVGLAIVIGNWTSQPASDLRRLWDKLEGIFKKTEESILSLVKDSVLKQAVASRELPNIHGHSISLQFPGIYGWSQEYHEKRIATGKNSKRVLRSLMRLKKSTELHEEMMAMAEKFGKLKEMELLLAGYTDVNQIRIAEHEAKKLLL
ncbi:hypothetical protein HDU99_005090 [Rhizoclosmatium hyalinum]|nr:hypothetical protein HDU99_005090 [Rhizoclosmatium hyalinum]